MDASDPANAETDIDATLHSAIGRLTNGLSPTALCTAGLDWGMHLIGSPSRQAELWRLSMSNMARAFQVPSPRDAEDNRFASPDWNRMPFAMYRHWFGLAEDWWQTATAPIDGVDPAHQRTVAFMTRQALDMACPANALLTNPTVLRKTAETKGHNLTHGLQNWIEDLNTYLAIRGIEAGHLDVSGGNAGTRTLTVNVYEQAFAVSNIGAGAAVAVVILMCLIAFSFVFFRFISREEGL